MDWHTVTNESQFIPVLDFEKQSLASTDLL
jgi:peptidyl-dipeptidase Dcp